MTNQTTKLHALLLEIKTADAANRDRLQPQLTRLIARMDAGAESVPADARQLNDELQNEAVEAQFDNLPV